VTKLYTDDAELYDIAFGWDVSSEVNWLYERLGRPRTLLEPGCGSGRMLAAFERRGVEVAGIDVSERMLELARERLGAEADLRLADMTDFDLGRRFDGAISPINTLLHLKPEQLAQHLDCMARHLVFGGAYLVQVGVFTPETHDPAAATDFEAARGDTSLRVRWEDVETDFDRGSSLQRSRVEVLTGDRAGEVLEEMHEMTLWTPTTWQRAIDASAFTEAATYDAGKREAWSRVGRDATGGLLWHELRLSGG
jgi:cyclopropane fatty-acyl-phospholipid synthase-like methyltransferase